jgi:hypothetical protein
MPPRRQKTTRNQQEPEPEPELSLPRTRPKNASHRPGADAAKALRVRRDPEVIQKEKKERQQRKEKKEQEKREEAARKEVAACFVDEYRSQQAVDIATEETLRQCHISQGAQITCFLYKVIY